MHVHPHVHLHARMHACTHSHTHTHTHTHTHQQAINTTVLVEMAEKEKRSKIEFDVVDFSPFFRFTSGGTFVPLYAASACNTCRASSTCPFNSNHLGDSGTILCG